MNWNPIKRVAPCPMSVHLTGCRHPGENCIHGWVMQSPDIWADDNYRRCAHCHGTGYAVGVVPSEMTWRIAAVMRALIALWRSPWTTRA